MNAAVRAWRPFAAGILALVEKYQKAVSLALAREGVLAGRGKQQAQACMCSAKAQVLTQIDKSWPGEEVPK